VTQLSGNQKKPYLKVDNDIPVFQFKELISVFLPKECADYSINRNIESSQSSTKQHKAAPLG